MASKNRQKGLKTVVLVLFASAMKAKEKPVAPDSISHLYNKVKSSQSGSAHGEECLKLKHKILSNQDGLYDLIFSKKNKG